MPSLVYMGVDERNDHSFRLPRPDLSVGTDIPNACNNCHKDKDASWATKSMKKWYGKMPIGKQNFSHQITALQKNSKDAQQFMYDLIMSDAPDMAKQTAIASLGNYPSKQTYTTTLQMTSSQNPLKRLNALKSLQVFQPRYRIRKTFKMLSDSDKIVRTEAARQLSTLKAGELDAKTKADLKKAMDEYEQTLLFNADRAESQTALAEFYTNQNRLDEADIAYKEALRLQPKFVPAYINYAYFKQAQGKEKETLNILNTGLKEVPKSVSLNEAIGLWYIRSHDNKKALVFLKKASELDLNNAHAQYAYAVALAETDMPAAIKILEASYKKHTGDLQVLYALVFYVQKIGDENKLKLYHKEIKPLENFRLKHK
jgi:tetratricopeptide (TPR) repeat protein